MVKERQIIPFPRSHIASRVGAKDRVRLKSGGPELLVSRLVQRDTDGVWCAECVWLDDDGAVQRRHYPIVCLLLCHARGDEWPEPMGIDCALD